MKIRSPAGQGKTGDHDDEVEKLVDFEEKKSAAEHGIRLLAWAYDKLPPVGKKGWYGAETCGHPPLSEERDRRTPEWQNRLKIK
jgi:hypothetical protein